MKLAGRAAAGRIPIVLDPVGAGATTLRTETVRQLLEELPVTVLRGNASEILACAGMDSATRGVDSTAAARDARLVAEELAVQRRFVVAVTGETDIVTDGRTTILVSNGHPLMGRVTGTGCAATTLVAAFCAASSNTLAATASALAFFGVAGQRAADAAGGPGTFWPALLDELYRMSAAELDQQARLRFLNAGEPEND
jgi:hydroxyethylthiazole kinase